MIIKFGRGLVLWRPEVPPVMYLNKELPSKIELEWKLLSYNSTQEEIDRNKTMVVDNL